MIARASLVAAALLFLFTPYALACFCREYKGPQPTPTAEAQAIFDKAKAMETSDARRAIALYKQSVKKKNGHAAKRLAEIYDTGISGIQRDYGEHLYWADVAQRLGVKMLVCSCTDGR